MWLDNLTDNLSVTEKGLYMKGRLKGKLMRMIRARYGRGWGSSGERNKVIAGQGVAMIRRTQNKQKQS